MLNYILYLKIKSILYFDFYFLFLIFLEQINVNLILNNYDKNKIYSGLNY